MTAETALKVGMAAGKVLAQGGGHRLRAVIGKDTRLSGYMFESALEAGFAAAGVESDMLGPIPTPGVAYLTRALRAQAGVVISASHNPHHDNGVKFFGPDGGKLSDEVEAEIEALIEQPLECVASTELGRARRIDDAQGRYIEFCKSSFPLSRNLNGLRVAVDCANGASYRTAPAVLEELGAQVTVIGNRPDGLNINRDCGSTHLEALRRTVASAKADVGIALDGDADRCLMLTADGREIDGDEILYIIARHRMASGVLNGPVVGTLMSNLGLEVALTQAGVGFHRAKVGDRYVLELLKEHGGELGGETSGHTLCLYRTTTGDGTITALQVLAAMLESGRGIGELAEGMRKFPQVLINVKLAGPADGVMASPAVKAAVVETERRLGRRGRVLLRPSGTEPLIRVMVEAQEEAETRAAAEYIADRVRAAAA
jgi:phosphoglucosamine mutase